MVGMVDKFVGWRGCRAQTSYIVSDCLICQGIPHSLDEIQASAANCLFNDLPTADTCELGPQMQSGMQGVSWCSS